MSDASLERAVLKKALEAIEDVAPTVGLALSPDFEIENLQVVAQILERLSEVEHTERSRQFCKEKMGCYLLELARRTFGGALLYSERFAQPILEWSQAERTVTAMMWNQVEKRIAGDVAADVVFHWRGIEEAIRRGTKPHVIYM